MRLFQAVAASVNSDYSNRVMDKTKRNISSFSASKPPNLKVFGFVCTHHICPSSMNKPSALIFSYEILLKLQFTQY